jgi:hypothetical protein
MQIRNTKVVSSLLLLTILQTSCHQVDGSIWGHRNKNKEASSLIVDNVEYVFHLIKKDDLIQQERLESELERTRRLEQLSGTIWFRITMGGSTSDTNPLRANVSGLEEYNSRIDYFNNVAMNDIRLDVGHSALHPISYHFENNYGLTPTDVILVGFDITGIEVDDGATIVFKNSVFQAGILKSFYTKEAIKKAL